MDRIFLNLHVVTNNSSQSVGGGGKTRVAMAPELDEPRDVKRLLFYNFNFLQNSGIIRETENFLY